jgi:DNA-binding CsgD family transcriptional regulator
MAGRTRAFQRLPRAVDWWSAAATKWETLGRPHRTAYARWRQAEALLERGDRSGAGDSLRRAWQQAADHEPLRRSVQELARTAGLSSTLVTAESVAREAEVRRSSSSRSWPDGDGPDAGSEARPKLTVREAQVMHLVVEGLTSEQIGRRLGIAERTVRKHLSAVYAKAGQHGRAGAAAWWQRNEGSIS